MNLSSKGRALHEWIKDWNGLTKLNAAVTEQGDLALTIEPGSTPINVFIDGTKRQSITFALSGMLDYSSLNNNINAQAQEMMEQWHAWIEQQDTASNYPDFGAAVVESLMPITTPAVATIYDNAAKYQFSAELIYTE